MAEKSPVSLRSILGMILCRVVVPAWIVTGAVFKLHEASPGLLPRNILLVGDRWLGMNLDLLLGILIVIEFFVAAVILLVGRLSKPLALAMLLIFCGVLIGEMAIGNTSCGCLGANSPAPWQMLVVDGLLLFGVAILTPWRMRPATIGAPLVAAIGVALVGAGITTMRLRPDAPPPIVIDPPSNGGVDDQPPTRVPATPALPSYWFNSDYEAWIGKPWREIDLFQFITEPPAGIDVGTRYVVFYGRTCEHCEAMFLDDLALDPQLAQLVTAVEVPAETDQLRGPNPWEMPDTDCAAFHELPIGVNWVMTTPLAIRLEDGRVAFAEEGDHHACFGLEQEP